jgi:hypothetical protein
MTFGLPAPDPLPVPAPPWLLHALLLATFFLHLLAMNLVLGGSILGAVARLRARSPDGGHLAALARAWAQALPVLFAATVTLGVAALLFLQVLYGRVFFASSVVMAWGWLAVVPLVMLAYAGAYALAAAKNRSRRWPSWVACGVAAAAVIVAFLYTNNMSLMLRPAALAARYQADARGLHLALDDAALVPRFLHTALGGVAIAGLAVALVGSRRRLRESGFGAWAMRHGSLWFVAATIVNLLVGFWWLGALPRHTVARLVGGDATAALVFAAGIAAGLAAVGAFIGGVAAPRPAASVRAGTVAALLSLACMIATRDHARRAALEAAGFAPATWVEPQWGAIALFAALFVAAAATVWWMVATLARRPAA